MGKKKERKKRQWRAVKLAMDCTWNVEGRTLKNKDEPSGQLEKGEGKKGGRKG
jgi:hypothetical protein